MLFRCFLFMGGRSQSSGALDHRATPGRCRAGEATRIPCGQWGFEIDKGRTPPIFWHPKIKRNNEVRWVGYCSFLEVVLVARDSCSKKTSGISRKPLALTEGSCTLHVSPCPLASELEETILGSICWTRCFTLIPNPDTMTCWDGGCIFVDLRWLSKHLWLSSRDFQEMTLYTQWYPVHLLFSILMFSF